MAGALREEEMEGSWEDAVNSFFSPSFARDLGRKERAVMHCGRLEWNAEEKITEELEMRTG